MKVLLIGSDGQLGHDIVRRWSASPLAKDELVPLSHADIEITDAAQVNEAFAALNPDLVINTAAYVLVDLAESEDRLAFDVNALAVKHVANACRHTGATFAHLSTDYVFDGEAASPYTEDATPAPVNTYGVSKAAGEQLVRAILPDDHLIIRTSGLYGLSAKRGRRGNFVEKILERAEQGQPLRVVSDQITSPTYTADLADAVLQLCARNGRGTYHAANSGECSWYDFAAEILSQRGLKPQLTAITSETLAAPARRPRYSVLACGRLGEFGLSPLRPWREALSAYLEELATS